MTQEFDLHGGMEGHWGQAPMSSTQGQLKIGYQKDDSYCSHVTLHS